jgi:nucleotide-binding universal stress UspA family protein
MKVLIPLDGSTTAERALQAARDLSLSLDAEVVLLHVLEPFASGPVGSLTREQAIEYLRAEQDQFATPVRCSVREGRTAIRGILDAVDDEHPDLVILATQGRTSHPDVPLGSVARQLPGLCRAPVVLIGPNVLPNGQPET